MLSLLAISLLSAPSPIDLATASPDAPALELGWRDGIRAKGGGRIRLLGEGEDDGGGFLDFHGFIEMHNGPGYHGFVPYEYWRGRFALEGGYRWKLDGQRPWVFRLTGGLEHESDHSTSPNVTNSPVDVGFVNLNSAALTAGVRHGRVAPTHAALTFRLHVITCTRDQQVCGRGGGLAGDRGFELELALTQELALWGVLQKWNLFASGWGQVTLGTRLIFPARRVAVRLGAIRHRKTDAFAFFFQTLAGTDVGYFRQQDTLQLGAGLAWTPD
jgi:hypothetical protein